MIENLITNKAYYERNTYYPFYTEVSIKHLNGDGTYATKDHPRAGVTETAEHSWYEDKEGAIKAQVDYYMSEFHNKDLSGKAIVYQEFAKEMGEYAHENYPEMFL